MVVSLSACDVLKKTYNEHLFCCGTYIDISMTLINKKPLSDTINIFNDIDTVADAYAAREKANIYDLNKTNEKLEISKELYDLLTVANDLAKEFELFNPLVGSLANEWKESLNKAQILPEGTIKAELDIIKNSSLVLEENNGKYYATRNGEAKIDLGAVAKGYALDRVYNEVLKDSDVTDYIVDAGSSSVLLGKCSKANEYYDNGDNYNIFIRYGYGRFAANSCVISTSSIWEQAAQIEHTWYSHIVNPITGSAAVKNATVIVVSEPGKGALGDVLSTVLTMCSPEEMKQIETKYNVKVAAFDEDGYPIYQNVNLNNDSYCAYD